MNDARPALDHLVLPTADLDLARQRLEALGFTVAPQGVHPFGTRNACVYFGDGTFLETLAIADAEIAKAAAAAGNVFVARDRQFRENAGNEGFSAVVLASQDADLDHDRFVTTGISAGERLDFSRVYRDAGGKDCEVAFRLAFAAPPRARSSFFFTCERVDAPSGGRGALALHRNGVSAISRVIATSSNIERDAAFLARFAGLPVDSIETSAELRLASTTMEIIEPASFEERFGHSAPDDDGQLSLAAIVFSCADTASIEAGLVRDAIANQRRDGALVVPPEPGQGATFIFEDQA